MDSAGHGWELRGPEMLSLRSPCCPSALGVPELGHREDVKPPPVRDDTRGQGTS